jgi:hypothetical protein
MKRLLNKIRYRFTPYRVQEKQISIEEITARCMNISNTYQNMGLVNSFSLYKSVIDALRVNRTIEIRPLAGLMEPAVEGKIVLSLRHDLDADIVTGLKAARFLASRGVSGSFYLLPTSHYYGEVENKIYSRYTSMAQFVAGFIATGCELGIHADPLHFYCNHGIDGIAALRGELEWLRSLGANIKGTVAHNSAVVYGAENFEIFKGKAVADRSQLKFDKLTIPLQSIEERELGLNYEGNYPLLPDMLEPDRVDEYVRLSHGDGVRKKAWLELYFLSNPYFDRQYDIDIWLLGEDAWVIAIRGESRRLLWPVSTIDMIAMLNDFEPGVRVVMNIHPEYVSGKEV